MTNKRFYLEKLVLITVFLLCIALVGCQPNGTVNYRQYGNKYNARVVKMNSSLKQSFLDSNRINYVFADVHQNPYVVKNIEIEDAVLKIELDMISSGGNNAKPPQRAFKFIRMKKAEFDSVEITR